MIFVVSNIFDVYSKFTAIRFKKEYNIFQLISYSKVNLIIIIIFFALIMISWTLLFVIINFSSKSMVNKELYFVKKNNDKVNEYILVYIIPFISVSASDFKGLILFAMVFIVIGMVTVRNDIVYVNPILYFRQYNIYLFKEYQETTESSILITKYTIMELKKNGNFKDNKIKMPTSKLSQNTYFIKK